jgi:hypothetical protein
LGAGTLGRGRSAVLMRGIDSFGILGGRVSPVATRGAHEGLGNAEVVFSGRDSDVWSLDVPAGSVIVGLEAFIVLPPAPHAPIWMVDGRPKQPRLLAAECTLVLYQSLKGVP